MLPGELSDAADAEDAEHWLQVYGELQGFLRRLIDTHSGHGKGNALEEQTLIALIRRLRVINERFAYWDQRRRELRRPGKC